jgi:hypothetical protein
MTTNGMDGVRLPAIIASDTAISPFTHKINCHELLILASICTV